MTALFNLATEPWIAVRCTDGERREVSLRDLIVDSEQITDIEIYPPVAYAVLVRIAAALVLRTQGALLAEARTGAWQEWGSERLTAGPDPAPLDEYLDRWEDRFWLLHPHHPFLQDAGIATECDKRSSTNKLRMEAASGNNFLWWTKTVDSEAPRLQHGDAAAHLLTQWGYGSGGRCAARQGVADSRQSPLRPRSQFLPRGRTLWVTLLACSAPAVGDHALAARDQCCWERESTAIPVPGQLGRLTESTRGLLLFGDSNGINDAVVTWGTKLPDTFFDSDVFSAVRHLKDGSRAPYQLPIDRLAWAEIPSLLAKLEGDPDRRVSPATVLDPSTNPVGASDEFYSSGITTVTHFADKSKDLDWSRSELPNILGALEEHDPMAFARIRQYCLYAHEAIDRTHKVARSLNAPGGMGSETFSVPDANGFRRQLWADAESGFWLTTGGADWEIQAGALRSQCLSRFAEATGHVTAARQLTGVVLGERRLRSRLRQLDDEFGLVTTKKGVA